MRAPTRAQIWQIDVQNNDNEVNYPDKKSLENEKRVLVEGAREYGFVNGSQG